ncbi:hypothetical protein GA0074692_4562 [Micromonospora pallida]|uniref:Uncharacterized protein n=1 Tax=Micromonospora pallida TaxID=145854 RepID=A0A1C6T5L9_9ACTN|nr:hypothetical protein [Micromonospora pallida]SCL37126.1 hypothetical protein GA0074692_4562 [Micromonospora pallida]
MGTLGIAYHQRVELAALDGPLARVTVLLGGRLIRRYLGMEADGLRREVERDTGR